MRVQYTSWLGEIKQTYKAVDVEVIGGMRSETEIVRATDKYLLQPFDERHVFAVWQVLVSARRLQPA